MFREIGYNVTSLMYLSNLPYSRHRNIKVSGDRLVDLRFPIRLQTEWLDMVGYSHVFLSKLNCIRYKWEEAADIFLHVPILQHHIGHQ